jgi:hypothetical protein
MEYHDYRMIFTFVMYVGLILGVCVGGRGDSPLRAVSEVTKSNYIEILRSQITLKFFHRWLRLSFRVYEFIYIYIHNLQHNSYVTEP